MVEYSLLKFFGLVPNLRPCANNQLAALIWHIVKDFSEDRNSFYVDQELQSITTWMFSLSKYTGFSYGHISLEEKNFYMNYWG